MKQRDAAPFLRPHVISGQVFGSSYREVPPAVALAQPNKRLKGIATNYWLGRIWAACLGASTSTSPYHVQAPYNLPSGSQMVILVLYPGNPDPWLISALNETTD
ncbi:TPA: hypothetical protein ACH3X3_008082 [Trebouxia sp. C0006]